MSAAADSRRERAFERLARRHRNRNYVAHLLHGLFGQTGMRLVNAPTFLPAYVYALSGAEWAVGLARGLQHLGMFPVRRSPRRPGSSTATGCCRWG